MCVFKNLAFIYFLRPPSWSGTLRSGDIFQLANPFHYVPPLIEKQLIRREKNLQDVCQTILLDDGDSVKGYLTKGLLIVRTLDTVTSVEICMCLNWWRFFSGVGARWFPFQYQ